MPKDVARTPDAMALDPETAPLLEEIRSDDGTPRDEGEDDPEQAGGE